MKKGSSAVDEIKGMRDEIKLKLHLASLEAKAQWQKLEGRLSELEDKAEKVGEQAGHATQELATDLKAALKKFKEHFID